MTTSAARCRPLTPATRNIPAAIATMHDRRADVGLREHQAGAARPRCRTAGSRPGSWGATCLISARLAASITINPILANSDGVIWNPADLEPTLGAGLRRAQERDPHQQQRHHDARVEETGVDLQEPVVERRHHEDQHDARSPPSPSACSPAGTDPADPVGASGWSRSTGGRSRAAAGSSSRAGASRRCGGSAGARRAYTRPATRSISPRPPPAPAPRRECGRSCS